MSSVFNIHEAKTQFSRLLAKVSAGQEVIISRAGKPIAKLVPITEKSGRRAPGSAKEMVIVSDDFNEPLPEQVLEEFEN